MTYFERIELVRDDIIHVAADLLVLKYANGLHGADLAVANEVGFHDEVARGEMRFVAGGATQAREIVFIGVGPLYDFRYGRIAEFTREMMEMLREARADVRTLAMTIHGPGYGLDEREALRAQIWGLLAFDGWQDLPDLRILIVERDATRFQRLQGILDDLSREFGSSSYFGLTAQDRDTMLFKHLAHEGESALEGDDPGPGLAEDVLPHLHVAVSGRRGIGKTSQIGEKPVLFVAMPFAEEHRDEYDIAFVEAAHDNGYLCERLDLEHFTGDIVAEIERRIRSSAGMIALLNDHNPNVFLEIGYAMAVDKPIIFVARKDQTIPFDIRNQRRVEYSRIAPLREDLRALIKGLSESGVLQR